MSPALTRIELASLNPIDTFASIGSSGRTSTSAPSASLTTVVPADERSRLVGSPAACANVTPNSEMFPIETNTPSLISP